MSSKISVVITTHNNLKYTQGLYNSLIKNTNINMEVIFVDDRSTDDTREWVNSLKPSKHIKDIILVEKETTRCFSESVNLGINKAKNELVLVCNNDILIMHNSIENLITSMSVVDLVAPTTNFVGLTNQFFPGPECCKPTTLLVNEVCFICFMVKKSVWNIVKMDEGYEFLFEDTDYCWELNKIGKKLGICLASFVYHEGSQTVNNVTEKGKYNELYVKSAKYFAEKWGKAGYERVKSVLEVKN